MTKVYLTRVKVGDKNVDDYIRLGFYKGSAFFFKRSTFNPVKKSIFAYLFLLNKIIVWFQLS